MTDQQDQPADKPAPKKRGAKKGSPRPRGAGTKPKLTDKMRAFAAAYLRTHDGQGSAIAAGYSAATAAQAACNMLKHPGVKVLLEAHAAKVEAKQVADSTRVLVEASRLGTYDPRTLFNPDGSPIPPCDLPDEIAAALVGLEVIEDTDKDGNVYQRKWKYKLAGKDASLALLAKYHDLFANAEKRAANDIAKANASAYRDVWADILTNVNGNSKPTPR